MADSGPFDLYLEYDGRKVGLILHRDEQTGTISWFPGLAPDLQPQFRTGSFGYEQTPAQIDIPISWQDWSLGCGFHDDPVETPQAGPRGYSYSRGVDASNGRRLYLSPTRNAVTGISDVAPTKFLHSTLGLFAIAGDDIYEWNTSTDVWTARDSGGGTAYTDIIEMDGVLYAARGSGADYKYSTDGTTWTAFTDSDDNFSYWAVRGQSSANAVLWGIKSDGTLKNTTDGRNSGVAWSSADAVGHTSETVNGAFELNDDIYITKLEGIYRYTGTSAEDVWRGGVQMSRTTNGKKPYVWVDLRAYVPYGDRLLRFDATEVRLDFVFPTERMRGHPEINGQITAVGGNSQWLFLALKNSAGNTYIIKGNPYRNNGEGEWHTYAYLGANDCNALAVIGPTSDGPQTNNPTLFIGYGNTAPYYILERQNLRPEDDANYTFDTGGGSLWGAFTGFGALAFPKFLNAGRVNGRNLSSTETIELKYEEDEDGTETTILTAESTGQTSDSIETEVQFNRIRPIVTLATGDSGETPIAEAVVLQATPNPPRKRSWVFYVQVADLLPLLGGGTHRYSGRDLEAFLFGSVEKRVTMYDRFGTSFVVRVLDVSGVGADDLSNAPVAVRAAEIGPAFS